VPVDLFEALLAADLVGIPGVEMSKLDSLNRLVVVWVFFFQMVLIVHFAVRRRVFDSYTAKYGWLVYALRASAVVISIVLLLGGRSWSFWPGGFLFLMYAASGFWIDYVTGIEWRNPLRVSIMVP
jgi:hypothetical protein